MLTLCRSGVSDGDDDRAEEIPFSEYDGPGSWEDVDPLSDTSAMAYDKLE